MGKSQNILVTGGTRGIGFNIAAALVGDGHNVSICARTADDVSQATAAFQANSTNTVNGYAVNISNGPDLEQVFQQIKEDTGAIIDVLINNAAVPGPLGRLDEVDIDAWSEAININLIGQVLCTRIALRQMIPQRRGTVINMCGAGVGWFNNEIGQTAYQTSKYAVYGFTEAIAKEAAVHNIQVNAISPGSVKTHLQTALSKGESTQARPASDMSSVLKTIRFLLSEDGQNINGKLISADWDDLEEMIKNIPDLKNSSLLTLKKIDGRNFGSL